MNKIWMHTYIIATVYVIIVKIKLLFKITKIQQNTTNILEG